MGNHNTKAKQLQFKPQDWTEVEKANLFEVMKSNTGQLAHLYHFMIKSDRPLDEQVQIYHRRRSAANWVQVIGAKIQKSGFGFCGTQENAIVLTQRIPILLNGLGRLNQEQSNVVLYNALRGFNDISKIVVPSSLNDKMIGFNEQGQTKVWVNENFGMNYPSYFNKQVKLNEKQVINHLLDAIKEKTSFNNEYLNALRNANSFSQALNFVRSNSGISQSNLDANRINISKYLSSVQQVPVLQQTKPLIETTINTPNIANIAPQTFTSTSNYYRPPAVSQSYNKKPMVQFVHNPTTTSGTIGMTSYVPATYTSGSYIQPTHGVSSTIVSKY